MISFFGWLMSDILLRGWIFHAQHPTPSTALRAGSNPPLIKGRDGSGILSTIEIDYVRCLQQGKMLPLRYAQGYGSLRSSMTRFLDRNEHSHYFSNPNRSVTRDPLRDYLAQLVLAFAVH